MPTTNPLEDTPVLVIFAVFAVVSFVAYEIGFQVGHWYQARTPGVQEGPTGVLVGSVLALLAFLRQNDNSSCSSSSSSSSSSEV